MAIPAGLVFLWSAIPVVLIASVSLLLDLVLKYENILKRCQIQILLWIVLSTTSSMAWRGLSKGGNDDVNGSESNGSGIDPEVVCSVFAHLTIFFNLMVPIVEVVPMSRWKRSARNGIQISRMSACWTMIIVVCYVLYLYTTETALKATTGVGKTWKFSLLAFTVIFLGLCFIRIYQNRRRKVLIDMQGMPMTVTTTSQASSSQNIIGGIVARFCGVIMAPTATDHNSPGQYNESCWLDERQWYKWSRAQTMQWFAQKLSSKVESGIFNEEKEMIVSILSPHRITGDVLDELVDISHLIALRVPFGPACRLSDSIAEMVERYPKPRRRNGANRRIGRNNVNTNPCEEAENNVDVRLSNDCLDLHDHEYNYRSREINDELKCVNQTQYPPAKTGDPGGQHRYSSEPVIHGGMSEEQHEKLNNVIKERFGLELPKLKAADLLEVQKGSAKKANSTNEAISSMNDGVLQSTPFYTSVVESNINPTVRSSYTNGSTVPSQQTLEPNSPWPSSSVKNEKFSSSPSSTGIPEHILNEMPSEIREIARRQPDLMQTIWKQKQQQVLKKQREPASSIPPVSAKRKTQLPSLSESIKQQSTRREDGGYASDIDYCSEDEDETTCLINRENITESPTLYKSVDKPMIPSII